MAFHPAPSPAMGMAMGMGEMDLEMSSTSIPQSNLRSSAQQLYTHPSHDLAAHSHDSFCSTDSLQYSNFAAPNQQQHNLNGHISAESNSFTASTYPTEIEFQSDFFTPGNDGDAFQGFSFGNTGSNHNFGGQYEPFSCDDCSSTNPATIQHHHHKTGRLAGAAPQLEGHFCCRWLVHGSPCLACCSSAEDLDNHIKSDHAGKDGTYRCLWQDCQKVDKATNTIQPVNFGNKPKLMRHVHSHTGHKPFPCPYPGCDKGFVTKEQLRNHETTHTKSRKYHCEQCGKAFAVKSALTTHITAVHEERKIHKCETCGKAFADSSNLSKHKQTHFKSAGVTKRRSTTTTTSSTAKRENSDGNSTRTSPSIPTPTQPPATPAFGHGDFNDSHARKPPLSYISPSDSMLPPTNSTGFSPTPPAFMPLHGPRAIPYATAYSNTAPSFSCGTAFSTTPSSPSHDEIQDPSIYLCRDENCIQQQVDYQPCWDPHCTEVAPASASMELHHNGPAISLGPAGIEICCNDERCTPPAGPPTPCNASDPDECDKRTICDRSNCLSGTEDPGSSDHSPPHPELLAANNKNVAVAAHGFCRLIAPASCYVGGGASMTAPHQTMLMKNDDIEALCGYQRPTVAAAAAAGSDDGLQKRSVGAMGGAGGGGGD